jgi:hypothetical protein
MDLFADKKTKLVFQIYQGDHRNFHLSGVGLFSLWNNGFLRVPRNENELILGKPWKIPDKFIEAYMDTIEYDSKDYNPCGYPIHERCWVLMTRILDVNLIKAHLNLFVKAICQMNKKPKIYDLAWKTCKETEWCNLKEYYGEKFTQNPGEYLARLERRMECSEKIYALRDPLKVIEVRNLIQEAETLRREQEKRTAKERPSSLNSEDVTTPCPYASFGPHPTSREKITSKIKPKTANPRHMMILRSSSTLQADKIILPAEIILLIMDRLPGCNEIRFLLWAFPHWSPMVPQTYWRARFVKDLMLDRKEVPGLDALDWQRVYFKIDHVFETSHGLRNQRRIMKVLEGTKALFLKYVADEAF